MTELEMIYMALIPIAIVIYVIVVFANSLFKIFLNKMFNNKLDKEYKIEFEETDNDSNYATSYSYKQEIRKNIIFPDEIKKAKRYGTSLKQKKIYISENPDVEFCNLNSNNTYESNSNNVKTERVFSNYEEVEKDDPIKECGTFNKRKKYYE